MEKESPDLREVIADMNLIKEVIRKNDSIIRFIDTGGALRQALLVGGLLIGAFSVAFYCLLERHGSFEAVPANLRIGLFALMGVSLFGIGYLRSRNLLHAARKVGMDATFYSLLKGCYTPRLQALHLPYISVTILVVIFLGSRGYNLYIIPSVATLFGLLVISLTSLFFLKEFYFLGVWLAATGVLSLFSAAAIHPLAVPGITFAAGFVLTSLLLYVELFSKEKRRSR